MSNIICRLFGHKWHDAGMTSASATHIAHKWYCLRCGKEEIMHKRLTVPPFNMSDPVSTSVMEPLFMPRPAKRS